MSLNWQAWVQNYEKNIENAYTNSMKKCQENHV